MARGLELFLIVGNIGEITINQKLQKQLMCFAYQPEKQKQTAGDKPKNVKQVN